MYSLFVIIVELNTVNKFMCQYIHKKISGSCVIFFSEHTNLETSLRSAYPTFQNWNTISVSTERLKTLEEPKFVFTSRRRNQVSELS
jgi:hypothetical protein